MKNKVYKLPGGLIMTFLEFAQAGEEKLGFFGITFIFPLYSSALDN